MCSQELYEGRQGVVVGGTHGIGMAIAEELVRGGAQVVVTGRNPDHARAAEAALGPAATAIVSDVTDAHDVAALAEQAGEIDALFINVGIAEPEPLADVTEASWDRQFDINAKGAFFTAQRLVPRVRPGGGVVFTTLMAKTASPDEAVYAATKAAVRAFARTLAAELVARDIRVNTVAPGFIDTRPSALLAPPPATARSCSEAAKRSPQCSASAPRLKSPVPRSSSLSKRPSPPGRSFKWTAASPRSTCLREPAAPESA